MFYPALPTAEEIKAVRTRHGLKKHQAAKIINVTPTSWWKYENGQQTPTVFNWALFLNAVGELSLPPDDVLTPFAERALSFVPPLSFRPGHAPENYVPPTTEQIAALRAKAGLSRRQCNDLFGYKSSAHWGKFERGEIVMPQREWVVFQVACGVMSPPPFSDFETAKTSRPSYAERKNYTPPSAEEIKAFLKEHGLTQTEAAKRVGVSDRQFRNYVSAKGTTAMPEKVWNFLRKSLTAENGSLPDNPDFTDFPTVETVGTAADMAAAVNTFALAADTLTKQNRERTKQLLPVFEIQVAVRKLTATQTAVYFRVPDYGNGYWTKWQGFGFGSEQLYGFLAAVTERYRNLNIVFEK